jgi:transposase
VLYWGGTGYCLWYQRLEQGSYEFPDATAENAQEGIEITPSQLSLILEGIDLSSVRRRKRYERPIKEVIAPELALV